MNDFESTRLVIDSSTLIALERAGLWGHLGELDAEILVPRAVAEEIGRNPEWAAVEELRGPSLAKAEELVETVGIGRGEAECLVLAKREDLDHVVTDDRKLIRQRVLLQDDYLRSVTVLGFSYLLHLLHEAGVLDDVREAFREIVEECGWKRSEVYVANYTFLKEMGY